MLSYRQFPTTDYTSGFEALAIVLSYFFVILIVAMTVLWVLVKIGLIRLEDD